MKFLTVGVAVVTFNGLKYLPAQLESIISQTRQVDHIVISDDNSTDGTWEFLNDWATNAPLRVTLIQNQQQLGVRANFEQAARAVEADVIFSSDQDDIWLPDKVKIIMEIFERNSSVQLVHTDAVLVDGQNEDLGKTLLSELELSQKERDAIFAGNAYQVYCRRNVVTGATAAFRAGLLQLACPMPNVTFHDAWLALMAAASGDIVLLDVPTIRYRQHSANLVGVKKQSVFMKARHLWWKINSPVPLKKTTDNIQSFYATLLARLSARSETPPAYAALVTDTLEFAKYRTSLPKNAVLRAPAVLRTFATGRYRRFSYTPWEDIIRDMLNR